MEFYGVLLLLGHLTLPSNLPSHPAHMHTHTRMQTHTHTRHCVAFLTLSSSILLPLPVFFSLLTSPLSV